MNTAVKLATYQDVLNAPENLVAELVQGVLYTMPRPAPRHALAASELTASIIPPFSRGRGGPGGWLILMETELHLGQDVLVPDLAGWRRERLSSLPAEAHLELAPDWICEVLSPSTVKFDRGIKLPRYAAAGVTHAWLVDPTAQTVEVYEGSQERPGHWLLLRTHSGADIIAAPPFDAVPLALSDLWEV